MTDHQNVRDSVSKAYAKAISQPSGGSGSCCRSAPTGVAARLAGYTPEELASLPAEAVVNSFGCGNPVAFSEVKEGDTVLDLGSGAGIDLLIAAKKVGPTGRAIGVDMTDEMIEKANENISAAGLSNVEVRKGIIEHLPVESASVDWVFSNCVINLSPEKDKVFSEIARVLRPGGRMLVSDLVVKDLPAWMREDPILYSSCIAGAISEEAYLSGLRGAGLIDAEIRDRQAYDESQLASLVASELEDGGMIACCSSTVDPARAVNLARQLAGRIWSAKIHARKPLT